MKKLSLPPTVAKKAQKSFWEHTVRSDMKEKVPDPFLAQKKSCLFLFCHTRLTTFSARHEARHANPRREKASLATRLGEKEAGKVSETLL